MESYLVAALKIFSCSMRTLSHNIWDLIPRAEIEPSTPALRARGLSHWTTREILCYHLLSYHPQSLAPCSSLPSAPSSHHFAFYPHESDCSRSLT